MNAHTHILDIKKNREKQISKGNRTGQLAYKTDLIWEGGVEEFSDIYGRKWVVWQ